MIATSRRLSIQASRALVLLGIALAIQLGSARAHAGADAAKRYFQNGVELITQAQPNYQDAYYQFELAYRESDKSWKVLGNLGLCALKLERDQEAMRYYELYLSQGGTEINREERAAIEQDLLLLKGNLGTVRITSSVRELKVVSRRIGSAAPPQSYGLRDGALELQLRAGSHTITASKGAKHLSWEVVLEPHTEASHDFDFDAAPAPPRVAEGKGRASGQAAGQRPTPDRPASTGLRTAGYVTLAGGATIAAVGGYFLQQSASYDAEASEIFACDATPQGCSTAQHDEVRRLESETETARVRAIVAFGVGGVAVATGVVLLLVAPSRAASPSRAAISPWLGPDSAGISGVF